MAFYSLASGASLGRGINYYKAGKVVSLERCDQGKIRGVVTGSDDNRYDVTIDLAHPKRSKCSCPFADGRQVICKHMIALYFTAVPNSFEAFEEDMRCLEEQYELEEERWRNETYERIKRDVSDMTAKEVREKLIKIYYRDALDFRYRNDPYY